MTVALDSTLITLGISTLLYKGQWERVVDRKTTGTDIFIGAGVTDHGETQPEIDLVVLTESILGFVLGYVPQLNTIDSQGYYYRDYDNPFVAGKWVRVGIPKQGIVILVLSHEDETIGRGDMIKCVDGAWMTTESGEIYQMIAEEAVTGAAQTRKYFYARWVKN